MGACEINNINPYQWLKQTEPAHQQLQTGTACQLAAAIIYMF
jgi:hypothetical protein